MINRNLRPALLIFLLTAVILFLPHPGLLAAGAAAAPNPAIMPVNGGFEAAGGEHLPGWRPDSSAQRVCVTDAAVSHCGSRSLRLDHPQFRQSVVWSDPVALETGRLYRLSGWIKTAGVRTDGTAQYPTPVPACLRMESMPITAWSTPLGGTQEWQQVEALFFAAQPQDRIGLYLGYRGPAAGTVWFDDLEITAVDDITAWMPRERIRRLGKAFRFEEQGWIYLHIEGAPYERGWQYGSLAAAEIKGFITKLAISRSKESPAAAWRDLRTQADLLFLRKFDRELLEEMQGIADGAREAGITVYDRAIDLIDVVTINSAIDLSYAADGIRNTPHLLSGQRLQRPEDEMDLSERLHKCSSFLANKSSTADGRIVFGQLFMWNGYMGPEWNVIVDLLPEKGNRLVYETFPGGIHSGADFYLNSAGIMIGETTVSQTPFNIDGTPQSNRIRLAAQYAKSVDDVVKYLATNNNGLYTNDWLIGDAKNDEIAIYCLGTHAAKLWRSSQSDFYNGQKDWYWSNNNPKALEVRKEYIANSDNAPYDLAFRPWDRDIEFWKFYERNRGRIDARTGMELLGSSPTNRPHACDGKITTSVMAEKMMFMAHYGKVTYREMFVNENGRIPDLPGAIPRLSLGYTTFSPLFLAEQIAAAAKPAPEVKAAEPKVESAAVDSFYLYPAKLLWANTLYPASTADNWLVSGSAAYWQLLKGLPAERSRAHTWLAGELADLNSRLLYTINREGALAPLQARQVYHETRHYYIPRIRGVYLLHQLRLTLGNARFSRFMGELHRQYGQKEITTARFRELAAAAGGERAAAIVDDWTARAELPALAAECQSTAADSAWRLRLVLRQEGQPFHLVTSVRIKTASRILYKSLVLDASTAEWSWELPEPPLEVVVNPDHDLPLVHDRCYTFSNFYDDWASTRIVYGTARQIEAQHTLAQRFARAAADRWTETILPISKDCEISRAELASQDIILLGGAGDNRWVKELGAACGLELANGWFKWQGKLYAAADDGLAVVLPNPDNPRRMLTIFAANSALQLHQMAKALPRFPAWALFKGEQISERGWHAGAGELGVAVASSGAAAAVDE